MKQHIIDDIQNCVQKFPNVFLFSTENMRNSKLKDLRTEWKPHSRFFFGKNRIMQIGLGKTETDEMAEGIHKVQSIIQVIIEFLISNFSISYQNNYKDSVACCSQQNQERKS